MKFTVALTLFAAASALELKEDESAFEAALDTAPLLMTAEGLSCTMEQMDDYLPEDETEAALTVAAVMAAIEAGATVADIMGDVFDMTVETDLEALKQQWEDITACIAAAVGDDDDSDDSWDD